MTEHHYTPIGPVPTNFPYMQELMREACIGYRDEMTTVKVPAEKDKDGKVTKYKTEKRPVRVWHIKQDIERVPITRRTTTGKSVKDQKLMAVAVNKHLVFCMLKDYVMHRIGKYGGATFDDVLKIVLGKITDYKTKDGIILDLTENLKQLRKSDWRAINNTLANEGVPGYSSIGDNAAVEIKVKQQEASLF